MVELVDTTDLKSVALGRAGSIPAMGIMKIFDIAKLDIHANRSFSSDKDTLEKILKECYDFQARIEKMSDNIGVSISIAPE